MSTDEKKVLKYVGPEYKENYIDELVSNKNKVQTNLNDSDPMFRAQMSAEILFRLNRIKKEPDRLVSLMKNFIIQKGRIMESFNEFLNFGISLF